MVEDNGGLQKRQLHKMHTVNQKRKTEHRVHRSTQNNELFTII